MGTGWAGKRMTIYALRKYFDVNGNDSLLLEQPNVTRTNINSHNLKTGMDFFAGKTNNIGYCFYRQFDRPQISSFSNIDWMSPSYVIDSSIITSGTRSIDFQRAGINFNGRHSFSDGAELTMDIDFIKFDIAGDQYFQTQLTTPGSMPLATKGNIPSRPEHLCS